MFTSVSFIFVDERVEPLCTRLSDLRQLTDAVLLADKLCGCASRAVPAQALVSDVFSGRYPCSVAMEWSFKTPAFCA